MTPQTVADTDAGAKPQTEETSAQEPSIDELLEQFKATETPPEQQPQKTDLKADDLREVVDYVRDARDEKANEQTTADIAAAAKVVKGDLDIDEEVVVDLLHGKAGRDPRFLKAYQVRRENPSDWESVLKAAGRELASSLTKPDQGLTDDRAAVEAAVRSASTGSTEEAPLDFNTMSDREFNAAQKKLIPR